MIIAIALFFISIGGVASANDWVNMSFYTDMQFGNQDSHVAIQNSNDRWDFFDWVQYTDGGNNTRGFRVRYHDDGLKPSGYYPILGGSEDAIAGTDVDDTWSYDHLWYVPIFLYAGGVNDMIYDGINVDDEAVWHYDSGDWRLVSKITGFDKKDTITAAKFLTASDWQWTLGGDVDRLWGDANYELDTTEEYPFFSYDLANGGNANGVFDTGDINVSTGDIVLQSQWEWMGTGDPETSPAMPYVNIESDQIGLIPEPATIIMILGGGIAGLAGIVRRRK